MKNKKLSGISRIDSGATHGWFVRAYRAGRTYSKFFSDLKNKGQNKALQLALQYRDQLRERLPPPNPYPRIMKRNSGNTSGVIGVSLTKRRSSAGTINEYYTVSWRPEPNVARNKSYSVASYGKDKAFALAVKFRKQKEKELQPKSSSRRKA